MNFSVVKEQAQQLFSQASFIAYIHNEQDYERALFLMDELIDEYDANKTLIEVLSVSISRWEDESPMLVDFNARIKQLDGVDTLKLLMEQHNLGINDLPEIGCKSLVSKILNRRDRHLTLKHVTALSKRFGVSPAIFC